MIDNNIKKEKKEKKSFNMLDHYIKAADLLPASSSSSTSILNSSNSTFSSSTNGVLNEYDYLPSIADMKQETFDDFPTSTISTIISSSSSSSNNNNNIKRENIGNCFNWNKRIMVEGIESNQDHPEIVLLNGDSFKESGYMYTKAIDRQRHYERTWELLKSTLLREFGDEDGDLGELSDQSQLKCKGLARVVLRAKTLQLVEVLSDPVSLRRVEADFTNCKSPHVSLFPGQHVLLSGNNPTGHCFLVSQCFLPPVPPPAMSYSFSSSIHPSEGPMLKMEGSEMESEWMICQGHFSGGDFLFDPLFVLQAKLSGRKNVRGLIFMGPFFEESLIPPYQGSPS